MSRVFSIVAAIFSLLLPFTLRAQRIEINRIVPERAAPRLHYKLVQACYDYRQFSDSPKTEADVRNYDRKVASAARSVHIRRSGDKTTVRALIKARKGWQWGTYAPEDVRTIHSSDYDFIAADLEVGDLPQVATLEGIVGIEPAFVSDDFLIQSVPDTKANAVWCGGDLSQPIPGCITGKNVFVGIIDTTPNRDHITFLDAGGNCRFNNFTINNPLHYHGTHVAGIAAGRGDANADYRGMACESNLLYYHKTSRVDAFQAMVQASGEAPLVVNCSVGTTFGPRDGTTLEEQALNTLITGNKILVCAAANQSTRYLPPDGMTYMHYQGILPSTPGDFLEFRIAMDTMLPIEIWHDNHLDVRVSDNDVFYPDWSPPVPEGEMYTYLLDNYSTTGDFITIINSSSNFYGTANLGQPNPSTSPSHVISIQFDSEDNVFESGIYRIRLFPKESGRNQKINAYVCMNGGDHGGFLSGDNYQTVCSPGLAANAITVASHRKSMHGGDISSFSSLGPMRTDAGNMVSKPDIAAPGGEFAGTNPPDPLKKILSASHNSNTAFDVGAQGTSMAAPHVTGAIALLMQSFPQLTAVQVKHILQESADSVYYAPDNSWHWQGNGTLTLEDRKYWGDGKLNVLAAYQHMVGFTYDTLDQVSRAKYKSASHHAFLKGLPTEPVNENYGNASWSKQKMSNGAIFLNSNDTAAYWLGEGIWQEWIKLDSVAGPLGLPVSRETMDTCNNLHPTAWFQHGRIWWSPSQPDTAFPAWYSPRFTADHTDGQLPFTVHFFDSSFISTLGNVTSRLWDFGDGSTSPEQNPVHTYTALGTFSVSLTLFDCNHPFKVTESACITTFADSASGNILRAEYFFDADPGPGNGTAIPLTPAPWVNLTRNISLAGVSPGLRRLCVRLQDENGRWSVVHNMPLLVTPTPAVSLPDISRVEYFFDTVVPNGGAIALSFTPGSPVSLTRNLPLASLLPGAHRLFFRTRSSNGKWSSLHRKPLLVLPQPQDLPLPDLIALEYFIDQNPGEGQATSLSVSPSANVNVSAAIPADTLLPGAHRIGFRARDARGRWSAVMGAPFEITTLPSVLNLSGITIPDGRDTCYAALQSLAVGTNDSAFIVQAGGSATLIAGGNIRFLPLVSVVPGGRLHGYISPSGPFCPVPAMPAVPATGTAMNEMTGAESSFLRIYPNPTAGSFLIEFSSGSGASLVTVQCYNRLGGMIQERSFHSGATPALSLSGHPPGLYLIRVKTDAQTAIARLIKL